MHAPLQNGRHGSHEPTHTAASAASCSDADGEAPPGVALVSLRTVGELESRPTRAPDFAAESRALVALAQAMAAAPRRILQTLSEITLDLCQAQTAGISLLEEDGSRFRWPTIVGQWECFIGGGTPRDYGPCGTVLDRDCPLLCSHPERDFDYLIPVKPQIEEALLLPFYLEGKAVGTLWVIMHDTSRRFDAEDLRMLTSLATFTSAAYQVWQASADASERLAAEVKARQDTDALNAQLRGEITEREKSQALLEAQKQLLEKVADNASPAEVFAALTDSVAALHPEARAAVLLADGAREKMGPVFSTTIPESFGKKITGLPIDNTCIGTCCAAIYQGETVTCREIATTALWSQPWRDLCAAHGVQACHSTPAFDAEGRAVASFALTFAAPHEPDAWERRLGEFGASVVGIVLTRDRAAHELRESEEFNRSLMMSSPDCVKVLDLAGHLLLMNERGLCQMEIDDFAAQCAGREWRSLWPAEATESIHRALAAARDGTPTSFEAFCPTAKGTPRWWEVSVSPVRDRAGAVVRLLAISRDITERKVGVAALHESRARFDMVKDATEVGFWFCDLPFDELVWDNRVKEHFWLAPETKVTIGTFYDRLHEEDRERTRVAIENSIANKTSYEIEYRTVADDGREKWIRAIGRTFYNEGGEPIRFDGVTFDITERKGTEEALRESEERFRVMADNITPLAWICDMLGNVIWYNRRWLDYTGLDFEAMKGWGWKQVQHPEHVGRVVATVEHSGATGEPWEDTFPLRGADGNYRWFLSRAVPIREAEGKIVRWFGTNTDVTELRDVQEELRRAKDEAEAANRAKDNFLAALSHELRTPLTPVLMTAAALREDERLPADVREQLGMIERNISLEGLLIDDLLDLTRIARGKLDLRLQPCDAHSLIALAVEIVRDDAQAKGIALEQALAAEKSGLSADPARFQQVIWNLLRNAVKFTPRGGRIAITTREADGQLLIEVSDSGIGILAQDLEKIFAPFEQAEATGEHRFGGLGLGLAIARAIVELHGGRIHAESAGVGRGATFHVELPGATEAPPGEKSAGDQELSTPHADGQPLHLLLVEDHGPTLSVLKQLLNRAGHRVTTAISVAEALAAAGRERPDLVISDLGLPDGAGTELMAQLRDEHGLTGIALTGYGMEDDVARTRAAGFATHLVKPIGFDQLRRALREGRSQMVRRS